MLTQHVFDADEMPPDEKLEAELNLAFQKMLENDLQNSPEKKEPVISGLPDVMAELEEWQGTDADKFKLLRLYSERLEVMEQLWSFQGPCKEIGRECLELVQERFETCIKEQKKPETVERFMERE